MGLLDKIKSALGLSNDGGSQGGDGSTDVSLAHEPNTESEAAVKGVENEETVASESDAAASTGSMTEEPPEEGVTGAAEPAEATGPQTGDARAGATPETDDEPPESTAEQGTEDTAASESNASASTGSMTEEPPEEGVAAAAEPAEATGPQSQVEEPAFDSEEEGELADEDGETDADEEPSEEGDTADTTELSTNEPAEGASPENDDEDVTDDRPVDSLSGIGSAYAERLADAGIETAGDLVNADPLTVAEESGISEKRIERWMETARETR